MSQALSDASIVYGHRVLPSSLRDHLPPIDNSWGAYGAEHDSGVAAGDDEDTEDTVNTEPGYSMDELLMRGRPRPDDGSARGRAATLAEGIVAITDAPALHVLHSILPHFPWKLSRSGYTTTYSQAGRPEADRSRPARLRLPHPGRVPIAQHADGSSRCTARRGARAADVAADVGRHIARRDLRPRHQPHTPRRRPQDRHRGEPGGGLPRATVHQGARSNHRRDP